MEVTSINSAGSLFGRSHLDQTAMTGIDDRLYSVLNILHTLFGDSIKLQPKTNSVVM